MGLPPITTPDGDESVSSERRVKRAPPRGHPDTIRKTKLQTLMRPPFVFAWASLRSPRRNVHADRLRDGYTSCQSGNHGAYDCGGNIRPPTSRGHLPAECPECNDRRQHDC